MEEEKKGAAPAKALRRDSQESYVRNFIPSHLISAYLGYSRHKSLKCKHKIQPRFSQDWAYFPLEGSTCHYSSFPSFRNILLLKALGVPESISQPNAANLTVLNLNVLLAVPLLLRSVTAEILSETGVRNHSSWACFAQLNAPEHFPRE